MMILKNRSLISLHDISAVLLLALFVLFAACDKLDPVRQVKVSAVTFLDTSATSVIVEGSILDMGENSILQVGFCWSTNDPPTINANKLETGLRQNIGVFRDTINNLWPDTEYFIRAYVRNEEKVFYGEVKSFNTYGSDDAQVSIAPLTDITMTSAKCGGTVFDDGGTNVTGRGICWGTLEHPSTSDQKTEDGTGSGSFVSSINGLLPNTSYYVRVYATNANGTAYGDQWKFRTMKSILTDIDGNDYYTVMIGTNEWMAKNLNVIHYRNGDLITYETDSATWSNLSTEAYCYYKNDPITYEDTYGALYNWFAVDDSRGLCPEGWSVPEDTVWNNLWVVLEDEHVAGGLMKEMGTLNWNSPNDRASNESSFTALPAGRRLHHGKFVAQGNKAHFWSSVVDEDSRAHHGELHYDDASLSLWSTDFKSGLSVRCIKD